MRVSVVNLHRGYGVNSSLVKRAVVSALNGCGRRGSSEIEIVFLTDKQIRSLNKRYKGEDSPTDVLSFDLDGTAEIFISIDKAGENSKLFKTTPGKEVTLYIIHGILHLAGYDDLTPKDRARMESRQDKILEAICKRENLSKVLTPR